MLPDDDPYRLPPGMPAPVDDGACEHLPGLPVPRVVLRSSAGRTVDVSEAARRPTVFYVYPGTLRPGVPIPAEWSSIPGARGCTVENLGFRDRYEDFRRRGYQVYGVSGQGQSEPEEGIREQTELAQRLRLPFELLNDSRLEFVRALGLPTFAVRLISPRFEFRGRVQTFALEGKTLAKRVTLVADGGRIRRAFYPVFPPNEAAVQVLAWIDGSSRETGPGGGSETRDPVAR
jgi:peroxiredoxin